MRRIAIFLPNWIGDVVMATPAVRAVREQFPTARLTAVCKPYVAETLAGSPWFDDTITTGRGVRGLARTARELRAAAVDTAILFPNSFRTALLARLGGCDRVVGFARYGRHALLSDRLYPARGTDGRPKPSPAIDDYNRIVERLGTSDPGHRMELFTTADDERAADDVWNRLGLGRHTELVGLNPGGAFGAAKHWPVGHFAALAGRLAKERGAGVLVLCGPTERETAAAIAVAAAHPNVVTIGDSPLSLGLTKAVVRRLGLLVTTDSGPRHFAAAFGRPVVTLFGPTHIGWTETYYPDAVHLQEAMPCGPCQQRTCPLGHHRCMTELSPGRAFNAAISLLDRTAERTRGRRHVG